MGANLGDVDAYSSDSDSDHTPREEAKIITKPKSVSRSLTRHVRACVFCASIYIFAMDVLCGIICPEM